MSASPSREIEPVLRSHDAARTSYDRISRWYDVFAGSSEWRFTRLGLQFLAPRDREHILEIGCGTGQALAILAQSLGPEGKVVGMDISGGMLHVAGRRLRKVGVLERVELVDADALDGLPCDDRCYDAIFMSFVLDLIDTAEIPGFLAECTRVLKPDGRLVIVAMSSRGANGLMSRLYRWAHRTFPKAIDCRPIPLHDLLEEHGYRVDRWEKGSMWGLPVEVARAVPGIYG